MISCRRAKEEEYDLFVFEDSTRRRTALLAERENEIIGTMEYKIINFYDAEIIRFESDESSEKKDVFEGLVEEILYWNPYLKTLGYNFDINTDQKLIDEQKYGNCGGQVLDIDGNSEVIKIRLTDITPEQLTVDKEKLAIVESWIEKPEDIVVSCVAIDGKTVCIDGYSRLLAAHRRGYNYVYAHVDEDADTKFYRECLSWCEVENIKTIEDLSERVVTTEEHQSIWINRCQAYFNDQTSLI